MQMDKLLDEHLQSRRSWLGGETRTAAVTDGLSSAVPALLAGSGGRGPMVLPPRSQLRMIE
jgi:hypothetical protein